MSEVDTRLADLRSARESIRKERLTLQRGMVRLAEEEAAILAASHRHEEAAAALQAAETLKETSNEG